nr:type II secretion system protein GspM [Aestuariicella hydrocarbonica]
MALGILLLLLILLYSLVIRPVFHYYQTALDEAERLEFELARYHNILNNRKTYEALLQRDLDQISRSGYFVTGDKSSIAAANLRTYLRDVVVGVGAQLSSTQDLSDREDAEIPDVGLKVNVTGDINQLSKIFLTLEAGQPLLYLEEVEIIANARRLRQPQRGKSQLQASQIQAQNPDVLNVRFHLIGFLEPEGV